MNTKVLSGLFFLALLATGCISEYNVMQSSNSKKPLFVTGNIIENTDVIFYISEGFSLASPSIPVESYISNAELTIIGSNGYKSPPAIHQGKGAYRIPVGALDDDVEYGIEIAHEGNTYQSTFSKPIPTPEIDSVSWIQPEKYSNVTFHVSTHDDSSGSRFFAWSYTEDWEIVASIPTRIFISSSWDYFYTNNSMALLYCWKKNESTVFLFGSTESLGENRIINQPLYQCDVSLDDRFTMLYCVTVNQRAISKGAYEYYQNVKKLNEEMGGLFTPQPTEFTGNITCITDPSKKIMGYVDVAKNTTQKRIFVDPAQITREWNNGCGRIFHEDVLRFLDSRSITFADYYRSGMRPAGDEDPEYYPETVPVAWAPSYCTECTANGGTKNKPDFWPNDHR